MSTVWQTHVASEAAALPAGGILDIYQCKECQAVRAWLVSARMFW